MQDHIIQQETVIDIDYDFFPHIRDDVKLFQIRTNHRRYSARTAVMATGGGTPVMPKPFAASLPSAASHAMWLDRDCVLSDDLRSKIRARKNVSVLVVGGGLTSAQIADCLIRKGVDRVHLVMRGSWKGTDLCWLCSMSPSADQATVKPFDVDLKWMSKFRNQQRAAFWTADDLEGKYSFFPDSLLHGVQ